MFSIATIVFVFSFLDFKAFTVAKYAADCMTPTNVEGKCMPIKSCARAIELLDAVFLKTTDMESSASELRESQCDFVDNTVFVCCANDQIQMNADVRAHLEQLNCGSFSTKKIANGEVAKLFDYRWMALLLYKENKDITCEGSLIDDRHILTAAHCLHDFKIPPIAVRLGEYNTSSEHDCGMIGSKEECSGPVEDINIEKIMPHEDYIKGEINNDIALLRLDRSVTFQKHIRPICLPISEELQKAKNENYIVTGWGLTQNQHTSDVLLWAGLNDRPIELCNRKLNLKLNEGMICAGGENYQDTCKGDSGGPLFQTGIYTDDVIRAIQVGIVSFGASSCGTLRYPAVYTKVSHYIQWITDHIAL